MKSLLATILAYVVLGFASAKNPHTLLIESLTDLPEWDDKGSGVAGLLLQMSNNVPTITGQNGDIVIEEESSVTISLDDLVVDDSDNVFPDDFTLQLVEGDNYTLDGATVIPDTDFNGNLSVSVTVNDGTDESAPFDLSIEVLPVNDAPVIIGLAQPVSTDEDIGFQLLTSDLTIEDPDNTAEDFTLTIGEGSNYTLKGRNIEPTKDFNGILNIPLTISDGDASSEVNIVEVTVNPVNDAPLVSGLIEPIVTEEDMSFQLSVSDFEISDPDNPLGNFVLVIGEGKNYTLQGSTIIPDQHYNGTLSIPIIVSDGEADSEGISIDALVSPVNDPPSIEGVVQPIVTDEDLAFQLDLSDLIVVDPDHDEKDLTLTIAEGSNYTFKGPNIVPAENFNGTLMLPVLVSDGEAETEATIDVTVNPINDVPVVNGLVESIAVDEDTGILLQISNLSITDPDNSAEDFVLTVGTGSNYTLDGNSILPEANFNGVLAIPVTVSDGEASSNENTIEITVNPVNDVPVITGPIAALITDEDVAFRLLVENLAIDDPDNEIEDFVLTIGEGNNYTLEGDTLLPDLNFNGTLSVPIVVSDGAASSEETSIEVTVNAVNDIPRITSILVTPTINEGDSYFLAVEDFEVEDPDHNPEDFELVIEAGANYTSVSDEIAPNQDFFGQLLVNVRISDGVDSSELVQFPIMVDRVLGFQSPVIHVYPNPVDEFVHINTNATQIVKVTLMSSNGAVIRKIDRNAEEINLTNVGAGVYFLRVELQGGEVVMEKILKD